ncbi:MAG TPA: hypothetical protein DDY32_01320 [Desulfobulbaceae bacterium]|nr:hypothetical protein [Desulfobulbaceae bacterium]
MKNASAWLIELFRTRETYTLQRQSVWKENRWLILASFICLILVIVARSWPNYVTPGLYVEDNSHYFNHFYGSTRGLQDILHTPNGYHNILNNLLAFLIAKMDVRLQPAVYLGLATVFAVMAVMILPCTGLLRNKYILFIAPFLLGLSGLNHIFYYITLTYQIYVFVILLICLLFWEPLKTNRANILLFALLSLLVWSGPYSVLVAPFSLCFILFFRGKTAFLTALTVVVVLYTLSVSNNMILLRNLWKPAIHEVWLGTLVAKVFLMGLGGAFTVKKLMLCLGFFLGLLAIFRRDSFYLKIACLLLVLINSSLAALFLSKKYMISLRVLPCYLVIAQFFWLFFLLFTADRLLALRKGLYHGGLVVALLAVLLIYRDNTLHPYKWSFPTMPKLAEFLQLVHDSEQLDLAGQHKGRILQFGHKSFRPVVRVGKTDTAAVEQIVMEEQ